MKDPESTNQKLPIKKTIQDMTQQEIVRELFRLGVESAANLTVMTFLVDSLDGDNNAIALKIEHSGMNVLSALAQVKEKYGA